MACQARYAFDSGPNSVSQRNDAMVESRMGAVAWAIRQRSVSHPRSSNRTCPIKASGSPTGFAERHTAGPCGADVRDAADRVLHRQRHKRTVGCRARHFVPSGEEVAHALINVSVNATECRSARPVAEVVRPTRRDLFSVSRTSGHGSWLPGTSRLPIFVLNRCTLFLDGLALRYQRPFAL